MDSSDRCINLGFQACSHCRQCANWHVDTIWTVIWWNKRSMNGQLSFSWTKILNDGCLLHISFTLLKVSALIYICYTWSTVDKEGKDSMDEYVEDKRQEQKNIDLPYIPLVKCNRLSLKLNFSALKALKDWCSDSSATLITALVKSVSSLSLSICLWKTETARTLYSGNQESIFCRCLFSSHISATSWVFFSFFFLHLLNFPSWCTLFSHVSCNFWCTTDWNVLTSTQWTAMKFCKDVHRGWTG